MIKNQVIEFPKREISNPINLPQSLTQLLGQFPTERYAKVDTLAASESRFDGYDIPKVSRQTLLSAINLVEISLLPVDQEKIKLEIGKLRYICKSRKSDEDDITLGLDVFAQYLSMPDLPGDITIETIQAWPDSEKGEFLPTVKELKSIILEKAKRREALLVSLKAELANLQSLKISQSIDHENLINVKASFRASHGNVMANTWIEKLRFVSRTDNTIKIQAESAFHKDWIKNKYLDDILFFWKKNDNSVEKLEVVL